MKIPAIIETHEANLSIEELEKIAEDVRLIITRGKGLALREYIERANIVSAWELGYRKTKALQFESKLEAYFPDEIFAILKLKWKTVLGQQFNDDDNEFFKVNASKGAIWLADRFYTNRKHMHDRLVKMGLIAPTQFHAWTNEEDIFLSKHADKGYEWLSEKMKIKVTALRARASLLKIRVFSETNDYSEQEDDFIKANTSTSIRLGE